MRFFLSIRESVYERVSLCVAIATDFCLKKSGILALFAKHMQVLGDRLNLHTAAIKRLGEHSADLQRQLDLMRSSMELMIQAKRERLLSAHASPDEFEELPN